MLGLKIAQAPAEFAMLTQLAGGARDREALEVLARQHIDWGHLVELAGFHGLTPHVFHALAQNRWISVPVEASDKLEAEFRRNIGKNLQLAGELLRIFDLFGAAKIRFAVFKGPALACALYGDLSRRAYNDIDLIVDKRQRFAAEDILLRQDYRARHGKRAFREAFLEYHRQYIFEKKDAMVDLHWDFVPAQTPFPLGGDEIWQSLATIEIAGRDVPTLGLDEQALMLAGHGTKEDWKSLSWICDFADFMRVNPGIDWMKLWRRAVARGQGRSILLACVLSAALFSAPVEDRLMAIAKTDPRVVERARKIVEDLVRPDAIAKATGHDDWRSLYLCETWVQKAEVLWAFVTTRTVGDYDLFPLPPSLWRLYFLIRPFRLGAKILIRRR